MSIAKVFLEGFVVSTPALETKAELDFIKFSVAVPGTHENEPTSFFQVRAWGKLAKIASALVEKGKYVRVEGSLKQREYEIMENDTSRKVYTVGVVAHRVDLPHEK
jgi:single-stranded DNA-binding protein